MAKVRKPRFYHPWMGLTYRHVRVKIKSVEKIYTFPLSIDIND